MAVSGDNIGARPRLLALLLQASVGRVVEIPDQAEPQEVGEVLAADQSGRFDAETARQHTITLYRLCDQGVLTFVKTEQRPAPPPHYTLVPRSIRMGPLTLEEEVRAARIKPEQAPSMVDVYTIELSGLIKARRLLTDRACPWFDIWVNKAGVAPLSSPSSVGIQAATAQLIREFEPMGYSETRIRSTIKDAKYMKGDQIRPARGEINVEEARRAILKNANPDSKVSDETERLRRIACEKRGIPFESAEGQRRRQLKAAA